MQGDPRESSPDRPGTLLVQLASGDGFMWGDLGTAQLFGDPVAVGRGDTSGCWWDWAD